MENKEYSPVEALNIALNMLNDISVKGFENTSKLVDGLRLIAKVIKALESAQKEPEVIELKPVEVDADDKTERPD